MSRFPVNQPRRIRFSCMLVHLPCMDPLTRSLPSASKCDRTLVPCRLRQTLLGPPWPSRIVRLVTTLNFHAGCTKRRWKIPRPRCWSEHSGEQHDLYRCWIPSRTRSLRRKNRMTTQTRNKIDSIAFKGLLLALAMFLVWYFVTLPVL